MNFTKACPSPLYLECLAQAQAHHLSSKTYSGKFLRPHAPFIKKIIDRLGCTSILDYGCGKGKQYEWVSHADEASIPKGMTLERYWETCTVYRYDPAWPPLAEPPDPGMRFDLVICTHALGSIPLTDLPWVIAELYTRANKAVYVAEKLGEVRKQVFSHPDSMPRGWSRADWVQALREVPHAADLEIQLATRERADGPDGEVNMSWTKIS